MSQQRNPFIDDEVAVNNDRALVVRNQVIIPHDDTNPEYQGRFYVFTINNPKLPGNRQLQGHEYEAFFRLIEDQVKVKITYMIFALERGESGTQHLQGYLQLSTRKKSLTMRNHFRALKGWVAAAKGSVEANVKYISKAPLAGPWVIGAADAEQGGTRTDLNECVEDMKKGLTFKSLVCKHPKVAIKYFGNMQKMSTFMDDRVRDYMTELYIYTGIPGSGKSHKAMAEGTQWLQEHGFNENVYFLSVPQKGQPLFWPGYNGQKVVVINDFYGEGINIDYFKNLIDKYPFTVNIKNSEAQFLARRVYVTSNAGWKTWWSSSLLSNKNNEKAIQRRITHAEEFTEEYISPEDRANIPVRSNAMVRESSFIGRVNAQFAPQADDADVGEAMALAGFLPEMHNSFFFN
jgi:hypothetical protein